MAAFVPYLIVGAIGIIGEWLIGPPGSKQNPNQMPQLNQSLRGSPIFVTFGTNRVSAQVPWTKNWKAVKGSGGKKGGGSGGMGAAKGGASQGYTYFWDSMFNYGFMDVPAFIGRGWVGNDPVKKEDILALNAGISGANLTLISSAYTSTSSNVIDLKYTEAHVSPGYNTGDANLLTWSYFQGQENVACAWPSTFWLGFRALSLGNSGQLPQLALELVPTNIGFGNGSGFMSLHTNTAKSQRFNAGMQIDDNGTLYSMEWNNGSNAGNPERITVFRASDGTKTGSVHDLTWNADVQALGLATGTPAWNCFIPIPGTKYVWGFGNGDAWGTNRSTLVCVQYAIGTDGSLTRQGGFAYRYENLQGGQVGSGGLNGGFSYYTAAGEVVLCFVARASGVVNSGTSATWIVKLPGPTNFSAGQTIIDTGGNGQTAMGGNGTGPLGVGPYCLEINELLADASPLSSSSDRNEYHCRSGCAPSATSTTLNVFIYMDKGTAHWHNTHTSADTGWSSYLGSISGANPNGAMIRFTVNTIPSAPTYSFVGVDNAFFLDTDGSTHMVPFSDAQKGYTGSATGDANDDYQGPVAYEDGSSFIMIGRGYSDQDGYAKVLLFTNNGSSATLAGSVTGKYADATTDLSEGGGALPDVSDMRLTGQGGGIYMNTDYVGGSFNPGTVVSQFGAVSGNQLDVTPPYIIKRILTSKVWGMQTDALFGFNITDARIDSASYDAAVAYCQAQGIYVSVTYTNPESLLNVINELVALYNGYIVEHGGVIYFGIVQDTVTAPPIRTIDNSHLISPGPGKPPVDITKGAIQDGFNIIEFQYLDRNLEYNQNTVWVTDEVDIDFNGPRHKTYPAKFVMSGSTAFQCAERALWSNLYGKDNYKFKLGVKDADLRPGNVVTLVDSFDNTLSAGVPAIITRWRENKRLEFEVEAVRLFNDHLTSQHAYTSTSSPDPGIGGQVDSVKPPLAMRAYELPRRFQQSEAFLYFGWNQQNKVMGGQLWLSMDGASYTEDLDVQPFPTAGILAAALPVRDPGYVETNIEVYLAPTSGFNANTPTYVQTFDLEDTTTAARQAGLTLMIVGSEAIACEGATLLAQNHYRIAKAYRGWGGTPIAAQNSGAYWNHHGDGVFNHQISAGDIGKIIYYKILPYNFAGNLCDISSVTAQTYQIKGDFWLPSAQAPVRAYVNSAVAHDVSSPLPGQYVAVLSGGCDVILQWWPSANQEGFGFAGFGNGGAGHFVADAATPSYRVDVMSSNGQRVSSFFANTGYFAYTRAQNSADFAGFAKDVIYKVTPYNSYGDGYVPVVRSLSLIW